MTDDRHQLDAIIDRAFLDAYDIHEQAMGLAIVISDGVEAPFSARVVGTTVRVVEATKRQCGLFPIPAAVCERDGQKYTVDLLDLEDWQDADGAKYIAAYRKYCGLAPWGD